MGGGVGCGMLGGGYFFFFVHSLMGKTKNFAGATAPTSHYVAPPLLGRVLGSGLCPRDKGSSSGCGKVRSVIDSRLCFMMFWRLFGVVLLMGMPMPWS